MREASSGFESPLRHHGLSGGWTDWKPVQPPLLGTSSRIPDWTPAEWLCHPVVDLTLLEHENALPVLLHVYNGPAFRLRFVESFVEAADKRLTAVGPFALGPSLRTDSRISSAMRIFSAHVRDLSFLCHSACFLRSSCTSFIQESPFELLPSVR